VNRRPSKPGWKATDFDLACLQDCETSPDDGHAALVVFERLRRLSAMTTLLREIVGGVPFFRSNLIHVKDSVRDTHQLLVDELLDAEV
jgi:hypothetical protein